MGALRNFNHIAALLAAQFFLLVLIVGDDMATWRGAMIPGGSTGLSEHLMMLATILVLLWLAWLTLLESVEGYWGISAKERIDSWLQPSLLVAAALLGIAAGYIVDTGRQGLDGIRLFPLIDVSMLPAIAATALLMWSAARRWKAIRNGVGKMREARGAIGSSSGLERITASIACEAGLADVSVRANPQGFTFAGLTSKPWHDPADFGWLPAFVDAVDDVRAEAQAVLAGHDERIEHYHYVGLGGNFWRNFSFVKRHEEIPANLDLCPVTARLLRTVPGYPSFRDAMYSILGPRGVVRPHRDVSNVFLTLHLPLIVPPGGYVDVGGIRREWRYGEPLIFDSSYAHEAVNPSDDTRVVLLVDFPHPDLSDVERDWVRASRI
jgi:beta-hydroxylase